MSKTQSQRLAYGEEIVALGAENPNVVALEADLGKSTMSCLFQQAYPDRYFEMGIAEQDMLSTAAGLAASGKIPFCSTFAVFATGRAYDQIRQTISIGKLNVKLCGSSSGLSDFGDGSTHQDIEDVALMSVIPNMTVLTPCDATETRQAVRMAAAIDGPVYIRVVRNDLPDYIGEDDKFEIGKLRVLNEGSDVAIFAQGSMVSASMKAAELLKAQGISAKVVNVSTMKPFNYAGVAEIAKSVKAVVTAEEHNYIGGLASAVALSLRTSAVPMDYVAVQDVFGQSAYGSPELMEHYGLTAENIVDKAKNLL
ncbi:transketolase family protein [Caproiciproducens faecalis]|uniref:Transketolase family protein n=1 Tax=Caproiciproducens faecalis TaxID=2820301 RepID=A0ABS7DLA8_9FIRM|nr:transketolase C-terminal domain-containing protein [Caproiciproducens faecalis]MBW7572058.1 transketolase family protein [Caproiciproducens faecalis]